MSGAFNTLSLREVVEDDLEIFYQHQLDEESNRMAAFTNRDPKDREAFDNHWQRIRNDATVCIRTIVVDEVVVGSVLSYLLDGNPELSYWIGREHWGRGIATRAVSEFLAEFTTRPFTARAAQDNVASIRVLEKNGFAICGYDRGFANARGEEIDEVLLILEE